MTRIVLAILIVTAPFLCLAQDGEEAEPRGLIEVHVSFVEFPAKVIAREKAVAESGILPHADVMTLWAAGKGELLHTLSVITRSGVAAEMRQVEEITYATEFKVDPAVSPRDKEGTKALPLIRPANLETREVGHILNVTPTLSGEREQIAVTISCEHSRIEDWIDIAPDIDGSGYGTIKVEIEQPVFAVHSTTTSVLLRNGESMVLGAVPSQDGDQTHYMILSTSAL